ncbi:MAG: sulfatase-like hydrolase/transferase [Phycisphaerales bacterium]|nr:sulfatase-like hydrolase/transferase [Phycisphaerales bacterium]
MKPGAFANKYPIPFGTPCLPEFFTDARWYTVSCGRLHFDPPNNPHGFQRLYLTDSYDPFYSDYHRDIAHCMKTGVITEQDIETPRASEKEYLFPGVSPVPAEYTTTSWSVDRAIDELTRSAGRNVFMNVGFIRPHPQFYAPPPWDTMYDPASIPLPVVGDEDFDESMEMIHRTRTHQARGRLPLCEYLEQDNLRRNMSLFYGDISHIDHNLGRLVAYLIQNDMFDDTLLICTADHGEMLGNHRLYLKNTFYEECSRIPMILSWPAGIKPGTRVDLPVSLQDIFHTCLDIIDHPAKGACQTYRHANLLDLVNGQAPVENRVYMELGNACRWSLFSVDEQWKYGFIIGLSGQTYEILYNLQKDPGEFHNLGKDAATAPLRRELKQNLQHYLQRGGVRNNRTTELLTALSQNG